MKKVRISIVLVLMLLLSSWGYLGHKNISYKAVAAFPSAMTGFSVWADSLSLHASDADNRKSSDSNESPKHYIDIDNYSEFISKGRIASTYDSIVKINGSSFVINNGTLPWATRITYDSLVNTFKKHQWHSAMLYASDLGHYVADGHMPLHLTSNYDGGDTGQNGIHSRYESSMVSTYLSSLTNYTATTALPISNINMYIMNYIYKNQLYVDSVLKADSYAQNLTGSITSSQYYTALWSKTCFTTTLFKNASGALASLIYNAWLEAGSPVYGSKLVNGLNSVSGTDLTVYPNPSKGKVWIKTTDFLWVEAYDYEGKLLQKNTSNALDISSFNNGIYLLKIYVGTRNVVQRKLILQH